MKLGIRTCINKNNYKTKKIKIIEISKFLFVFPMISLTTESIVLIIKGTHYIGSGIVLGYFILHCKTSRLDTKEYFMLVCLSKISLSSIPFKFLFFFS